MPPPRLHPPPRRNGTLPWAWAHELNSEELPMSMHIACIRRIHRASLISATLALQPVLARLKENPMDRAANNIMWLFPRQVLRHDPPKTGKAHGRLSQRRREMLQRHADAAPDGDCMSQHILRFSDGVWEELHEDYLVVARLSLDSSFSPDPEEVQKHAFEADDRLAGMGELSRAMSRLLDNGRRVDSAQSSVAVLTPKHPTTGGITRALSDYLTGVVTRQRDTIELTQENVQWALANAPRGTAPGPSGWMIEHWKDLAEDKDAQECLIAFTKKGHVRPPPLFVHASAVGRMQHRRASQAAGRAGRGAKPSPNLDGRDAAPHHRQGCHAPVEGAHHPVPGAAAVRRRL
jgi:hypothetical protein